MSEPTVVKMTREALERAISAAREPMHGAPPDDECCDSPRGEWMWVEGFLGGRWMPRSWCVNAFLALKLLAELPLRAVHQITASAACGNAPDGTARIVPADFCEWTARLWYEHTTGQRVELVPDVEAKAKTPPPFNDDDWEGQADDGIDDDVPFMG